MIISTILKTFWRNTPSHPLLDVIQWRETMEHDVEVTNETFDYYRHYDATAQAKFVFDCLNDTIENIILNEVVYLRKYDAFKGFLEDKYEMPDKIVAVLARFLQQNDGKLSKRTR